MSDELDEFKTEILETLDRAEEALLAFDQLPDGQSSIPLYDEIFRAYHNIKGAAGMLDWAELQQHIHQLENVLMQTKSSSSIPKKNIGWFLKGNDATRAIMAGETYEFASEVEPSFAPDENPTQEEIPQELYSEVDEAVERISSALMQLESGVTKSELIDSVYRDTHSLKGAVQLFGLSTASNLAHAMESSLESYRGQKEIVMDRALSGTLLLCLDLMGQCVHEPASKDIIKEANFMIGLLAPFQSAVQVKIEPKVVKEPQDPIDIVVTKKDIQSEVKTSNEPADKSDSSIRVQVSLLDRLMALMGEMVLVRNQVLQYSNNSDDLEFLNLSKKLDAVTSELQEETMKTRMQPIGNILNKFQRVVRDLSGSLDKKINLILIGIETELDKSLIEAVKDPLTHIVRNACDHGIETPANRIQNGKGDTGNITIRAYHEGGQVIVDISDDGRGLSREKLLNKAIEKGIIEKEKAGALSDREVHMLIFAPGFSTAEKITNVSGRGVGMDVVKSNIEKIGGVVDISSQEGNGTKITLKIPLTLAIVPALIVKSCNDRYAIPQVKLVELIRIENKSVEYLQGRPVYLLRGNILPLVNLEEVFEMKTSEILLEDKAINIVVVSSHGQLFGMIVDEIMDTADIVVKPLARFLKKLSIYSGATVLGDGGVAFILDVLGIAQKHCGVDTLSNDNANSLDKHATHEVIENELREYVLVSLGTVAKHAIPLSVVSRMEEIKMSSFEYSGHQRVARYRGGVLKIISLNDFFGYTSGDPSRDVVQVIVVKIDDQLFGIEVNQIIDVLSTRAYLDDSQTSHPAISGNLVTDEEIIVVVNIEKVIEKLVHYKPTIVEGQNILHSSARILLVEDTDSIRNKVHQLLSELGHSVEIAVDGVDGLKKIAEHKFQFDLIVSDIEMPKMNGFEFVKKVRTIDRMKDTPIIAFSTKNSDAALVDAKAAGFTTYIEKSKIRLLPLLIEECMKSPKRKSA